MNTQYMNKQRWAPPASAQLPYKPQQGVFIAGATINEGKILQTVALKHSHFITSDVLQGQYELSTYE